MVEGESAGQSSFTLELKTDFHSFSLPIQLYEATESSKPNSFALHSIIEPHYKVNSHLATSPMAAL